MNSSLVMGCKIIKEKIGDKVISWDSKEQQTYTIQEVKIFS